MQVSILLTKKCQLDCIHCFANARRFSHETLTKDDIVKILKKLKEMHDFLGIEQKVSFHIGGGEPLLLGVDFLRYFAGTAESFFPNSKFSMNTNLISYSKEFAKFVEDYDVEVTVSYDPEIRILDGSFEKFAKVWADKFKLAQDDGVNMIVCFVITKKILSFDLFNFVQNHNIKNIFLEIFLPAGRGRKNRNELEVTCREISDFMINAHKMLSSLGINVYPVQSMIDGQSNTPMDCDIYKNHYIIMPDGKIGSCEIRNFECRRGVFGNIFTDSVSDIVFSKEAREFLSKMATEYDRKCLNCEYIHRCMGGCRCVKSLIQSDGECHGFKSIFDYIYILQKKEDKYVY